MRFRRYAIYHVPQNGPLAQFGAEWLGWDIRVGRSVAQPDVPGIDKVTQRPRRYGFHATLKAPFTLSPECTEQDLRQALRRFAETTPAARCAGLQLAQIGRFLALVSMGEDAELTALAADCVRHLDHFRAPWGAEDLARRSERLSAPLRANLRNWGYPRVFEAFRFHMTLTGPLPRGSEAMWRDILLDHLPELPQPHVIDALALCGEDRDGRFHIVEQVPLQP